MKRKIMLFAVIIVLFAVSAHAEIVCSIKTTTRPEGCQRGPNSCLQTTTHSGIANFDGDEIVEVQFERRKCSKVDGNTDVALGMCQGKKAIAVNGAWYIQDTGYAYEDGRCQPVDDTSAKTYDGVNEIKKSQGEQGDSLARLDKKFTSYEDVESERAEESNKNTAILACRQRVADYNDSLRASRQQDQLAQIADQNSCVGESSLAVAGVNMLYRLAKGGDTGGGVMTNKDGDETNVAVGMVNTVCNKFKKKSRKKNATDPDLLPRSLSKCNSKPDYDPVSDK